jgi:hypothetical protein
MSERIELRCDPPSGIDRIEFRTITEILRGRTELEEWKDVFVRKPRVAEILTRTVFPPTNAYARPFDIQVDGTSPGREKVRHLRKIAVDDRVILTLVDSEVTVRATKHVLFLRDRTLDVCAARNVGIRHIEDSEAGSSAPRHRACNIAPVSRKHLDAKARLALAALRAPALQVLRSDEMIEAGRPDAFERIDRLSKDSATSSCFGPTEASP